MLHNVGILNHHLAPVSTVFGPEMDPLQEVIHQTIRAASSEILQDLPFIRLTRLWLK